MRKIAFHEGGHRIRKVILHETTNGTYLYLCDRATDSGGFADNWYEDTEEALVAGERHFGVPREMWAPLEDPLPGCLDDYEGPVRKKSDAPLQLERLVDGRWVPFTR